MLNTAPALVFLFDVDNTLLDSDRFKLDLSERLERDFGKTGLEAFWQLHNARREQLGYADHLGTVQEFRVGREDHLPLLQLAGYLLEYPFAQRLLPNALQVIRHLGAFGQTVILTEGDMVYQPRKVQSAGIWEAVEGRVMIPLDKRLVSAAVQQRFPAAHYVLVEDKPLLLAALKLQMGEGLTTIFVRQGHYAREAVDQVIEPAPDITIEHIGALLDFDRSRFACAATKNGSEMTVRQRTEASSFGLKTWTSHSGAAPTLSHAMSTQEQHDDPKKG